MGHINDAYSHLEERGSFHPPHPILRPQDHRPWEREEGEEIRVEEEGANPEDQAGPIILHAVFRLDLDRNSLPGRIQ